MDRKTKIKIAVALLSILVYVYIIQRIINFDQWTELNSYISANKLKLVAAFFIQIPLLALNIFLESAKWQLLIKPVTPITLKTAVTTTLAAMALGNITPVRTGEHVGRVIDAATGTKTIAATISILSGIIQTIVITIFFIATLPFITIHYFLFSDIKQTHFIVVIILTLITLSLIIWVLRFKRISLQNYLVQIKTALKSSNVNINYITKPVLLASLRYIVFASQLAIMLYSTGSLSSLSQLILLLPSYYFIITIVPSFIIADLGIKGGVALSTFSTLGVAEPMIISSIFAIWIVNSLIPTIAGHIILIKKAQQ